MRSDFAIAAIASTNSAGAARPPGYPSRPSRSRAPASASGWSKNKDASGPSVAGFDWRRRGGYLLLLRSPANLRWARACGASGRRSTDPRSRYPRPQARCPALQHADRAPRIRRAAFRTRSVSGSATRSPQARSVRQITGRPTRLPRSRLRTPLQVDQSASCLATHPHFPHQVRTCAL